VCQDLNEALRTHNQRKDANTEARLEPNTMANKIFRWACVIGWMAVIFFFSAQPHSGEATKHYLGGFNVPIRKAAHMTEYAVLFLLSRWATFGTTSNTALRGWIPALLSFAYACTDEFHQSFVPGRSAQFSDVLVDSTGILIAWLSTRFAKPKLKSSSKDA
jgi:VanZ family protein